MRTRRLLEYRDAVALLGCDDPAGLAALDEALGGVLSLATGGASETVLNLVQAQGRILRMGRALLGRLPQLLSSEDRVGRTRQLEAAHAVLVVSAYFEQLHEISLPFDWSQARFTRREQLALAGSSQGDAQDLARAIASTGVPVPAAHRPYEEVVREIGAWYSSLERRLLVFLRGLAFWDRLSDSQRAMTARQISTVPAGAVVRYQELYTQLSVDVPEFSMWSSRIEHQATRTVVREALTGVESLLNGLAHVLAPVNVAGALSAAYRAALDRPILAEGNVPADVRLPTVADSYLDPLFRVKATSMDRSPADEGWWSTAEVRADLSEFLAGTFTGLEATSAPLVVLGQPGAGKSTLTRVLAARLHTAGFLPVRIALREVPAEAEVQDQIEYAIRSVTGEHPSWPELVRATPGVVPVLLFDGFDELLQATGVSQSDFLIRVAAFQQREADQGRPVIALVTTRTAVADRARYPDGTVALRLEPFDDLQVRAWVAMWNRTNEQRFAATGIRPLPVALVEHHHDLTAHPLLLLMLALYDATDNALQRGTTPLDEADLYEDLLVVFATREVNKAASALPDSDIAAGVRQELERLSLVAFAMLNRRRQWVTASELEDDLSALLKRPAAIESRFRAPLDHAEAALGRFFFIQRAQAIQDAHHLATYEFLHATFGEYLAVRLAVDLLHSLLDRRPSLAVAAAPVDDDLLYVLLSYVPLSGRQMLRFVHARIARIPEPDRHRLADLIVHMVQGNLVRTQHHHERYRPDPNRPTSTRHGLYEANLVLLMLTLTGGFMARRIFPESVDIPSAWHRRALLWRSSMNEEEWTGFALSLRLRHLRADERRDLEVLPALDPPGKPESVDPAWLFGYDSEPPHGVRMTMWRRTYWDDLLQKMTVSGGTNDSVVRHALEPVMQFFGPELMIFTRASGGTASSVVHDVMRLWLTSRMPASTLQLGKAYNRCAEWLGQPWAEKLRPLILDLFAEDAHRLPPRLVDHLLRTLNSSVPLGEDTAGPVLSAAVAALAEEPSDSVRQSLLTVARSAALFYAPGDLRAWEAWLKVHDHALAGPIYRGQASQRLQNCHLDSLPPVLRHRIRRVAAIDYPDVTR